MLPWLYPGAYADVAPVHSLDPFNDSIERDDMANEFTGEAFLEALADGSLIWISSLNFGIPVRVCYSVCDTIAW